MPEQAAPIEITQDKDVHVVEFTNNKILDEANINEIKLALVHLIESNEKPRVLLDFGNVDHLSSAALGVLIDINNRIRQQNGMLRMACIKPQIMEVFQITKLDKLFRIFSTRDQAMHSFKE
ncbi:MAG: STAS domain-containing protein [Phycisphaerae bacterium]